jgi:HSP20 family protein
MLPVVLARRINPFHAFDDLLDGINCRAANRSPGDGHTASNLAVDIREDQNGLVIEAELPGFTGDQIDLSVDRNVLTIAAERKVETEDKKDGYHLRERRYGRMERSFRLPDTADGENVAAELKNGLLILRVPTREEAKPRKIAVK